MKIDPKDVPMPKFGKSALELLNDRNTVPPNLSSLYGIPVAGGIIGASMHAGRNWSYRRPMIAGAHMYPIMFAAGVAVTQLIYNYRVNWWAERDAVMRHYIELHPEDFAPPARKTYGEVLLEWVPIR